MAASPPGPAGTPTGAADDTEINGRAAPPVEVELDLLGGFAVRAGGRPLELPLGAQRVVAFVALAGRPVTRALVAGTLWSDSTEERAAASLRSALWRIKRAGAPLLVVTGATARLADGVRLDVHEVARLCQAVIEGDGPSAWTAAHLEWLRSDLLSGWYDDWVMFERERLHHLRLAALETLCLQLIDAGRLELAVQAGVQAVAAEPLRESARRALIEAHLALGNVCAAAREFQAYRQLLDDELGVEPSPLLMKLADARFVAPPHRR